MNILYRYLNYNIHIEALSINETNKEANKDVNKKTLF